MNGNFSVIVFGGIVLKQVIWPTVVPKSQLYTQVYGCWGSQVTRLAKAARNVGELESVLSSIVRQSESVEDRFLWCYIFRRIWTSRVWFRATPHWLIFPFRSLDIDLFLPICMMSWQFSQPFDTAVFFYWHTDCFLLRPVCLDCFLWNALKCTTGHTYAAWKCSIWTGHGCHGELCQGWPEGQSLAIPISFLFLLGAPSAGSCCVRTFLLVFATAMANTLFVLPSGVVLCVYLYSSAYIGRHSSSCGGIGSVQGRGTGTCSMGMLFLIGLPAPLTGAGLRPSTCASFKSNPLVKSQVLGLMLLLFRPWCAQCWQSVFAPALRIRLFWEGQPPPTPPPPTPHIGEEVSEQFWGSFP